MEILVSSALILFLFLSFARPVWALYLIILLLPSYQIRFSVFGIPATFLEAMILLLAGAVLWKSSPFGRSPEWGKIGKTTLLFIGVFLLAAAISVFTSPDLVRAAGIWKAFFVEPVVFFFLLIYLIDTKEKLNNLFKIFATLVLFLSLFGIYQFLTLSNLPPSWWAVDVASRRITSLVNHPNALAHLLGPLLAILISLALTSKNLLSKKILYPSIGLGALAFYLTFSRAGWLALIITLIGFGAWSLKKMTLKNIVPVIVLLCLSVAVIFAIPFSREKILDLASGSDLSQQNRYVLWSAAVDIIKNNPIFGVGLTGFREAYKSYPLGPDGVVQNYPHNFIFNFWLEIGLFGLIGIIGLLVFFYKKILALIKQGWPYALPAAAGMTIILLHGLVDVPYFKNDLSVLFWSILALPYLKIE